MSQENIAPFTEEEKESLTTVLHSHAEAIHMIRLEGSMQMGALNFILEVLIKAGITTQEEFDKAMVAAVESIKAEMEKELQKLNDEYEDAEVKEDTKPGEEVSEEEKERVGE